MILLIRMCACIRWDKIRVGIDWHCTLAICMIEINCIVWISCLPKYLILTSNCKDSAQVVEILTRHSFILFAICWKIWWEWFDYLCFIIIITIHFVINIHHHHTIFTSLQRKKQKVSEMVFSLNKNRVLALCWECYAMCASVYYDVNIFPSNDVNVRYYFHLLRALCILIY